MIEEWKEIIVEGTSYEISSLGKVRYLDTKELVEPKFDGHYYYIGYFRRLHRLVAEAFIPNPQHLPQVNHKDENKLNNSVDNLEWCSIKYNNNYGTKIQRISEAVSRSLIGNTRVKGKKWSKEARKQQSLRNRGEANGFYGKHHSEETRRIISEKNRSLDKRVWMRKDDRSTLVYVQNIDQALLDGYEFGRTTMKKRTSK